MSTSSFTIEYTLPCEHCGRNKNCHTRIGNCVRKGDVDLLEGHIVNLTQCPGYKEKECRRKSTGKPPAGLIDLRGKSRVIKRSTWDFLKTLTPPIKEVEKYPGENRRH